MTRRTWAPRRAFLFLGILSALSAQTVSTEILGLVTDSTGAVIPGAAVKARVSVNFGVPVEGGASKGGGAELDRAAKGLSSRTADSDDYRHSAGACRDGAEGV